MAALEDVYLVTTDNSRECLRYNRLLHENRAECLFSLLKPYLRVLRGISKTNLAGYVGFFQFLRNVRQHNALEQAELILRAALGPAIARRAKKGEFVTCFDHFDLLQTAIN